MGRVSRYSSPSPCTGSRSARAGSWPAFGRAVNLTAEHFRALRPE